MITLPVGPFSDVTTTVDPMTGAIYVEAPGKAVLVLGMDLDDLLENVKIAIAFRDAE